MQMFAVCALLRVRTNERTAESAAAASASDKLNSSFQFEERGCAENENAQLPLLLRHIWGVVSLLIVITSFWEDIRR